MGEPTAQEKAHQKYEMKRKGKPRYSGYLTSDQKAMFTTVTQLGGYDSEKDMIIAAVTQLHKKLSN